MVHKIASRRALYLAVLLHDIAKGRGGDHSELGGEIAQNLGPRLGLTAEETETVAWLVLHHLLMSNTAFKRDIDDPRTIENFAGVVQSPERLRLLLVLTVADIRAVGPKTWNNWKAALLRELLLAHGREALRRAQTLAADARARTASEALCARACRLDAGRDRAASRPRPCRLLARLRDAPPWRARRDCFGPWRLKASRSPSTHVWNRARGSTEMTVATADRLGLFADLAGALALAGADIVDARIFTLADGIVLDSFTIQDAGGAFEEPSKLARLAAIIRRIVVDSPATGRRRSPSRRRPSRRFDLLPSRPGADRQQGERRPPR